MSRVEDDLRVNTLEVLGSASIPGLASFNPATFGLSLTGKNLAVAHATITTTGSFQTVYTCPASKRALMLATIYGNNSGVTAAISPVIGVGGITITYTAFSITTTNLVLVLNETNFPIPILEAGDTYGINTNQQPIGVYVSFLEFDNTNNLKSVKKVGSWIVGDNMIYTVPGGKTAVAVFGPQVGQQSYLNFAYGNASGSTATMKTNLVPSGGSPSNANLLQHSTGVGTGGQQGLSSNAPILMAAGDFFSINTSLTTDPQLGFVTVMEI
jgi:hypothetical protein